MNGNALWSPTIEAHYERNRRALAYEDAVERVAALKVQLQQAEAERDAAKHAFFAAL